MRVIGAVLIAVSAAVAQSKGTSVDQAVDAVREAVRGKDQKKLARLANEQLPDPWKVAEELSRRGEHDAAAAFAAAAQGPRVAKLVDYVAWRRQQTPDARADAAIREANRCFQRNDFEGALAAVKDIPADTPDVLSCRVLMCRAGALRGKKRWKQAAAMFVETGELAEKLGWWVGASNAFQRAGVMRANDVDYIGAEKAFRRMLRCAEQSASRRAECSARLNIAVVLRRRAQYEQSIAMARAALALAEETQDAVRKRKALQGIAAALDALGEHEKAVLMHRCLLAEYERAGDERSMAQTHNNLGVAYKALGDYESAIHAYERSLALKGKIGDERGIGNTYMNMGVVYRRLGHYTRGVEQLQKALKIAEDVKNPKGRFDALSALGVNYRYSGDYERAIACHQQALRILARTNAQHLKIRELSKLGLAQSDAGDLAAALASLERARKLAGPKASLTARAVAAHNSGYVHAGFGDFKTALHYYRQSLEIRKQSPDRTLQLPALANIGALQASLGDHDGALQTLREALAIVKDKRAPFDRVLLDSMVGNAYRLAGQFDEAIDHLERAAAFFEKSGHLRFQILTLKQLGQARIGLGQEKQADVILARALRIAKELGIPAWESQVLFTIAGLRFVQGDPQAAMDAARRGTAAQITELEGLDDSRAVRARESRTFHFAIGIRAAWECRNPAEFFYFVETSRAGALSEALGGRARMDALTLSPELREAQSTAQSEERAALTLYRHALRGKDETEVGRKRRALDAAREQSQEIAERIQRVAKASAGVRMGATDLRSVQKTLGGQEALVLYQLLPDHWSALVVTPKEARLVELGRAPALPDLAAALARPDGGAASRGLALKRNPKSSGTRLDELRAKLIDPLALDRTTKRILVCPDAGLAYIPFALLARDREVVYVPSGTTYQMLRNEANKRGKGTLAMADPHYQPDQKQIAEQLFGGAGTFPPLPGSRAEAESVGDVVLIGEQATEGALDAALATRPRWRSVHFACHGLVNAERPSLSALVLCADKGGDGFLTTPEIFRKKIASDLVVLSACETGKGKLYRAEGVVGFTRAFMFAGAPRVMVSLWKVDDAATKSLMVKFYELWNGGKAPATALKEAQAFVASQKGWESPYYWAAWQLWGLPD